MNICLIGYMGSGKTSVGKLLAKRNGMIFQDTDELIVSKEGRSIPNIFETDGEAYFRDTEHALVVDMSEDKTLDNTVISTGGGLVIAERNRDYLKKVGKVIYLKASCETIYDRVKDDTNRPLLEGEDRMAKIRSMLDYRGPIYEAVCDYVVETDGLDKVEVAEMIERLCGILEK